MARLQDYPAEGSRDVIEWELARQAPKPKRTTEAVTAQEVQRLLGELGAARVAAVRLSSKSPP